MISTSKKYIYILFYLNIFFMGCIGLFNEVVCQMSAGELELN